MTRTGGRDVARESPFGGIRNLAARAVETESVGNTDEPSEAGKKLVFALDYAKCAAEAKVDESARMAMNALVNKVKGKGDIKIQESGEARKITYKGLRISVIKGPGGHPEMAVSFPEGMSRTAADECFEEFVGILGSLGEDAVKNEGERRTLTLEGTTIGLPVKNPFTGGVRFKILEPSGVNKEPMVVLDSECMDAINAVIGEEQTGTGMAVNFDGMRPEFFQSKYEAYQKYKKAAEQMGEREVDRNAERKAAFPLDELARLIEFLQQRLKVNISPTATVFSAEPAHPDLPIS